MHQKVSDSLERKHSHLSTQPLSFSINICHSLLLLCSWGPPGDKKLLSLTSLSHLALDTQAFLADLQFLLQISPWKAILIAVLLQTMQFSCLQEFPHVESIFYLTWNLRPALCWVSAGSSWVWADRCWGCVLPGLYRRLVQGLLHPNTASG